MDRRNIEMNIQEPSTFYIVDYEWTGQNVLFVKIAGFDAEKGKEFEGVVKFLRGTPFGDMIHSEKSTLSENDRKTLLTYLIRKFNEKEFH